MLFHQINDWLCTGLSGCESIRQRLPPLVGILACLIPGGIMCCLLSQIRGWRPVLLSGALTNDQPFDVRPAQCRSLAAGRCSHGWAVQRIQFDYEPVL